MALRLPCPSAPFFFFIFVSLILGDTTVLLLARDKYNITYLIILQGFLPPKTDPKAAPQASFCPSTSLGILFDPERNRRAEQGRRISFNFSKRDKTVRALHQIPAEKSGKTVVFCG